MFSNIGGNNNKFKYPYTVNHSCRFNSTDFAYLNRTSVGAVTSKKTFSISLWIKRCSIPSSGFMPLFSKYVGATNQAYFNFSDNKLVYYDNPSSAVASFSTDNVFRDSSAWYHILGVWDSTDGTAADRIKFYVNGAREDVTIATAVALNQDFRLNTEGNTIDMSRYSEGGGHYLEAYLADTYLIDGQALTPSSFGQTVKGVWTPKAYTGTYGLNGFYLDYSNSSDFGEDQSGNNNDWTDNNLAINDQVEDTPTNNWCTLNSIHQLSTATISNGNLECSGSENEYGTFGIESGKWAWEITVNENGSFGVISQYGDEEVAADVSGEVVEMVFDADNGTLKKRVDGGSLETIEASVDMTKTWFPFFKAACAIDFGQLGFSITDNDYKYLNTNNLKRLSNTVLEGNKGFDAHEFVGTGAGNITAFEFQPDLVWIKRTSGAGSHLLFDSVRASTNYLESDTTDVEAIDANSLTSFNSDGFTLGNSALTGGGATYISWCWKESQSYGFDIVSYTGDGANRTIAHNLSSAPEMMIVKTRTSTAKNWVVYHNQMAPFPEDGFLGLNDTWAYGAHAGVWNGTAPTSSVFSLGTSSNTNDSGEDFIAYLFASINGFSNVFSYTGNGNVDGPFVYTGFRPRYVMIKNVSNVGSWILQDTERSPNNQINDYLKVDTSDAEDTAGENEIDFLSNGFKIRNTDSTQNTNTDIYVGITFAETPFKYANAK